MWGSVGEVSKLFIPLTVVSKTWDLVKGLRLIDLWLVCLPLLINRCFVVEDQWPLPLVIEEAIFRKGGRCLGRAGVAVRAYQRKQFNGREMKAIKEVVIDDDCSDRGRQRRNRDEIQCLNKVTFET